MRHEHMGWRRGGPWGRRHNKEHGEGHEGHEGHEGRGHGFGREGRGHGFGREGRGHGFGHERGRWFGPFGGGRRGPPFGRGGPHFGGPPGGDPFGEDGGRRRQRRGDIKFALLELLNERPRHGYDLINALEERYGGFYRPSPGSVYPTLQLLEDEGHLTSDTQDGKRVYTLTDSGRTLLAERRRTEESGGPRRGRAMREEPEEIGDLRRTVHALLSGVTQVAQHGTPDQVRAAVALLESARRDVYRILAQENSAGE